MPVPDYAVQEAAPPAEYPTIMAMQDTASTHTVTFKDSDGNGVDLSGASAVKIVSKEFLWDDDLYIDKAVTVTDASNGVVEVALSASDVEYAGVYLAELIALDGSGNALNNARLYLNIDTTLKKTDNTHAPITIPYLRLALYDRDPEDNSLLESLEFTDTVLAFCLRRPIDIYNDLPPHGATSYTPSTFPYRDLWLTGALSEVYRMAARKLLRNRFPVQASNIKVDDKQRAPVYDQWGKEMAQEFERKAREIKYNVSWRGCFGRTENKYFG